MRLLLALLFLTQIGFAQSNWATTRPSNLQAASYASNCFAPFYHGVASGDPLPDKVIIWTRVTPPDSSSTAIMVQWEVATDLSFSNIIVSDSMATDMSKDYTTKVDITGLSPNTYYYYRFKALNQTSLVGRTKTAPTTLVDRMRVAAISCSDYRRGYFITYRNLAARNDLDVIVHLGDYIYESSGGPSNRLHEPNAEVYRLQDYRSRLSQYHMDPDLIRCHQMHPFVVIWDDHDIVVDALRDTSFRHNPSFGAYSDRKYAAVKAMREWLPIRDDSTEFYKNWKKLPFGDLVDLFAIDVRLYDRDRFATSANDSIYGTADHKLLGPVQMNWLNTSLRQSTARWKLIANQLMIGHLGVLGTPLVFENWDGYPVERDTFFNNLIQHDVDNVVFMTGDFHCSIVSDLTPEPHDTNVYNPQTGEGSIGVEYIVPSITGDNFDEGNDYGLPGASTAVTLMQMANPNIKYAELEGHGYVLLDIDTNRVQAEFWHLSDILDPNNSGESCAQIYYNSHQENKTQVGTTVSSPKTGIPAAPQADTCYHVGIKEVETPQPIMLSVAPNPFSQFVLANYVLMEDMSVTISLYNAMGQRLESKYYWQQAKGNYNYYLPTDDLPQGIYFLELKTADYQFTKKIVKQ